MLTSPLKHFAVAEFQHPELVDDTAARALDMVRELYGKPLTLTSDARSILDEESLPNHAEPPSSSLHVQGRAFDLRWAFDDPTDCYNFFKAVFDTCRVFGFAAEIEPRSPHSGQSVHMHLGFFPAGHPGKVEL